MRFDEAFEASHGSRKWRAEPSTNLGRLEGFPLFVLARRSTEAVRNCVESLLSDNIASILPPADLSNFCLKSDEPDNVKTQGTVAESDRCQIQT